MKGVPGAPRVPRRRLLEAADKAGVLFISSPKLAALADVSIATAWAWSRGRTVLPSSDSAIRSALRLPAGR